MVSLRKASCSIYCPVSGFIQSLPCLFSLCIVHLFGINHLGQPFGSWFVCSFFFFFKQIGNWDSLRLIWAICFVMGFELRTHVSGDKRFSLVRSDFCKFCWYPYFFIPCRYISITTPHLSAIAGFHSNVNISLYYIGWPSSSIFFHNPVSLSCCCSFLTDIKKIES